MLLDEQPDLLDRLADLSRFGAAAHRNPVNS
jgi:hypothetical protein